MASGIVSNIVAGFLANLASEAVEALLKELKQFKSAKEEIRNLDHYQCCAFGCGREASHQQSDQSLAPAAARSDVRCR